jgi:hypothetical protein
MWDDNSTRCDRNKAAILTAAQQGGKTVHVQTWTESVAPSDAANINTDFHLLILHNTNKSVADQWISDNCVKAKFVLKYGGSPVVDGIPRAVSASSPFTGREAKAILEAAETASSAQDFIAKVVAIWSTQIESCLALRLLCEAWLLLRWDKASSFSKRDELAKALQIGPDNYQLPEGVQLNSPQSAETWIAPFRENHDEDPIGSITRQLPSETAKAAVRAFFTDMERSQPDFPRVADLFLLLDGVVRGSN